MVWDYIIIVFMIFLLNIIVDLMYYSENGVWELLFMMIRFEKLLYYFVVVFNFYLKRWFLYFVIYILILLCMMLILNILVFMLLLDSGECVGYFIDCLLVLIVFIIFVLEGFL